ncbi:hypothetical protein [Phytohabitans houttuyneae]|uniref:Uncharacterized protein n=1 Tax=Phytohabitans houttuyneae TaxID=1076126 RepID=A0A6V8K397_9ACTN|nr:hypothetical protein [Phytohabitans houttuyneae]GFJ76758.1 hypothetical protein Phou_009380 [Phytohabitans houttuyneae]
MALTKQDHELVAFLLMNVFEMKVPFYAHAHPHASDVRAQRPVLATVMEVQRGWDPSKRRTWKLYVAAIEAELNVDTALLAYCPDPRLARRYRDMFDAPGWSLSMRPFIFTPDDVPLVVNVDEARKNPSLAVLAAICHGSRTDVDEAFPALIAAMRAAGARQATLYDDIVLAGLPAAARARREAFMITTVGYEYRSELFRNLAAQAEARAILTLLKARGIAVPDDVREEILGCTDLTQLDAWLLRAASASTIEDVTRA